MLHDRSGVRSNNQKRFYYFATYVPPEKLRNIMMSFLRLLKLIYSLLKRRSSRKNSRKNARSKKMLLFAYEQKDVQETSLDITVNTPSQSIFAKFKAGS